MTDLGVLRPGGGSGAKSIDAKGEIVGVASTGLKSPNPVDVAVRWSGGKIEDLTTGAPLQIVWRKDKGTRRGGPRPPNTLLFSEGCGIASDGRVAGMADIRSAGRCLIQCEDGKVTAVQNVWHVSGMNDSGQVVGDGFGTGAFLYWKGSFYDIPRLCVGPHETWVGLKANAVSNSGQIAATATVDSGGSFRAVLLTPVPAERKPN